MKRTVLFVCSSALHVTLFAQAIRLLAAPLVLTPVILSLDEYYAHIHGNVSTGANALQLPAEIVLIPLAQNPRSKFIARVWQARTEGVRIFKAILNQHPRPIVVLGNDTGHAERAAMAAARQVGATTILVQDGFVIDSSGSGTFNDIALAVRRLWLFCGGDAVGWVPYGMGGCNVIAVHGRKAEEIMKRRRRRATKLIRITGHSALRIETGLSMPPPKGVGDVLFFCTNYLTGLNDLRAHRAQIAEVLALRRLMDTHSENSPLHVKLHPTDNIDDYIDLLTPNNIIIHTDIDLDSLIADSWLCITNISAAALDCAAHGRVCLLSGISLHNPSYRRLFATLPGVKFANWDELVAWMGRLRVDDYYKQVLEAQIEALAPWVDSADSRTGAERLAALLCDLSEAS